MTARSIIVILCGLLVLAAPACHDPVAPPVENLKPEACFEPQVYDSLRRLDAGILTVSFAADPLCSSDDRTPRHDLEMRYDVENDGVWDTDWAPLGYADGLVPDPLPVDVWEARMEIRDSEGRTEEAVATLPLPDYVPRGADVGLGFIVEFRKLVIGEGYVSYEVSSVVWGWNLSEFAPVECTVHVDGELVTRGSITPGNALDRSVLMFYERLAATFSAELAPFMTSGTHEITIAVDTAGAVDEVDETNNSRTITVQVMEVVP